MSRVDPPDYPAWPTGRRLLTLWWEQRRLAFRGLVCAFAYSAVSLAIPVLIQRAIDNAVVDHSQPLWPYVTAIVVFAFLRMGINFTRRYATARVGIRIEPGAVGVAGAPGRQPADTLRPRHDRMESRHESLDLAVVEYRAVAEVTGEQRRPHPF